MKSIKMLLVSLFVSLAAICVAQQNKEIQLSVHYGYKELSSEPSPYWPIRQDINAYSDSYNPNAYANAHVNYWGIGPELFLMNNKIALNSGLRFTNISSQIAKSDYNDGGYLYLRVNLDATNTDFFRVKNITENSYYLGIPFEARFIPIQHKVFSFYLKLSAELAYKISTKTQINFRNREMQIYEKDIVNSLTRKVNPLFSTLGLSVGTTMKLGNKLNGSMDIFFPSVLMSGNLSSLVEATNFAGLQFSLSVPLK